MTPRPSGIIFLACVAMLASTILPGGCQRLDRLDVEEEDACYTVDNVRCVFPFRFAGRFFDRCTNLQDKDNRFWCSTKTRPNGQHVEGEGEWGYCRADCLNRTEQKNILALQLDQMISTPVVPVQPESLTSMTTSSLNPNPGSTLSPAPPLEDWTLPDPKANECGLFNQNSEMFPFMALIGYQIENRAVTYKCSGTLINHRFVVTAAHCHAIEPIYEVVLGENIVGKDPDCPGCQEVERFYPGPRDIRIHEDFTLEYVVSEGNDIALIKLPRAVKFRAEVSPICLPLWNTMTTNIHSVVGWGSEVTQLGIANYSLIDESLRGQEILLAEEIPTGTCKSMPDLEEVHEQRHLCVKVTDQTSSCRSSDSGSPLLSLDNEHPFSPVYLEGILSFRGRPCLGEPVIFTNVDFYLSWILQTMTEL